MSVQIIPGTALQLQQRPMTMGTLRGIGIHFAVVVQTGYAQLLTAHKTPLIFQFGISLLSYPITFKQYLEPLWFIPFRRIHSYSFCLETHGMRKVGIQIGNHFLCRLNHQLLKSVFGLEPLLPSPALLAPGQVFRDFVGDHPSLLIVMSPFWFSFSCLARLVKLSSLIQFPLKMY